MNKDAIIADIIRRSSAGWRSLVFEQDDFGDYEQYVHFGPNSVEALLEHAPALEVFRVNGAPDIKSKDIQRLLCSPAKLKELYLLSPFRRDNDDENCSLNAYDAVKSDWVCTSLKVFGCQVGEIPRLDITHTIAGEAPIYYVVKGTKQESMDLQRRVCDQFARLQHLDELMLGVPFNSDYDSYRRHDKECGQRYDCLAMSLESGLGLMKGLKNLRLVGLEDMEVGMCNDK
ncbi:hypothetical protein BGX33_007579 [Mortierella sp. NVP41]|nr:hypothetical protein BGX33_007579 [Mortierella sp. NVP41]